MVCQRVAVRCGAPHPQRRGSYEHLQRAGSVRLEWIGVVCFQLAHHQVWNTGQLWSRLYQHHREWRCLLQVHQWRAARYHSLQHAVSLQAAVEGGPRNLRDGHMALQTRFSDRRSALGVSVGGDRTRERARGPLCSSPQLWQSGLHNRQGNGVLQNLGPAHWHRLRSVRQSQDGAEGRLRQIQHPHYDQRYDQLQPDVLSHGERPVGRSAHDGMPILRMLSSWSRVRSR